MNCTKMCFRLRELSEPTECWRRWRRRCLPLGDSEHQTVSADSLGRPGQGGETAGHWDDGGHLHLRAGEQELRPVQNKVRHQTPDITCYLIRIIGCNLRPNSSRELLSNPNSMSQHCGGEMSWQTSRFLNLVLYLLVSSTADQTLIMDVGDAEKR